jgi:hypothetical protein
VEGIDSEPEPNLMVWSNPDPSGYETPQTKTLPVMEVFNSSLEYDPRRRLSAPTVQEHWVVNLV